MLMLAAWGRGSRDRDWDWGPTLPSGKWEEVCVHPASNTTQHNATHHRHHHHLTSPHSAHLTQQPKTPPRTTRPLLPFIAILCFSKCPSSPVLQCPTPARHRTVSTSPCSRTSTKERRLAFHLPSALHARRPLARRAMAQIKCTRHIVPSCGTRPPPPVAPLLFLADPSQPASSLVHDRTDRSPAL